MEENHQNIEKIKKKLDKLSKKVLENFESHIMGITLLPPPKITEDMNIEESKLSEMKEKLEELKKKHNVLILVNDSDSKDMSKAELNSKLSKVIEEIAKEIDPDISTQIMLVSELWDSLMESKYEFLDIIGMSAVIYDNGIINTLKVANLHKHMTVSKFEKYIVSYVLAGSLMTGKAHKDSDIDIFIVVDDTDVKKMPRYELKEKLNVIIHQMSFEAAEKTGVKTAIHIQTYLLSDFWEGLRDANPVYFTLLRDGMPLYDRGMFVPWKQLLQRGKIKPSREAIEMLMHGGEQFITRIEAKMKEIAMEDFFWAIHSPSQAALMTFGISPPAPSETVRLMREIFVDKEKLLEEEYILILEKILKIRKDFEHGDKKSVTGKELQELIDDSKKYLDRIKKLFEQIDRTKENENLQNVNDSTISLIRDCLKIKGFDKIKETDLLKTFEEELINSSDIKKNTLTKVKKLLDSNKKKHTLDEVVKLKKDFGEVFKELIDFIERSKGKKIEEIKIKIHSPDKKGEILVMDNCAFIIEYGSEKAVFKAVIKKDGSFEKPAESNLEEFEKKLETFEPKERTRISSKMFESIKEFFGDKAEIIL